MNQPFKLREGAHKMPGGWGGGGGLFTIISLCTDMYQSIHLVIHSPQHNYLAILVVLSLG